METGDAQRNDGEQEEWGSGLPTPGQRLARAGAFGVRFGAVLKARRIALGLTQEQVAEAAGLHHTSVSNFELGKQTPSVANALLLAEALGMRGAALLREAEDGQR